MFTIIHEDRKTRKVYVKDFKIGPGEIREIFFTSEMETILKFENQDSAKQVFDELVAPSNVKALRIEVI